MRSKDRVSVIIIFLDAERFLEEAIASVFAQTYDRWELLLVDDGSSDGSTAIARSYAQRHRDRVRYLEHENHVNRGMSASRNLGISYAAGDYIAFLDGDDVWLPQKLEEQAAIFKLRPSAGMVYGPTEWWYSWTETSEHVDQDFILPLGVATNTLIAPPALLVNFLKNESISPCTCSVLLRREVVEQVGGFEDEFRTLYEDQAFFAKVCLQAPVIASDACWCRYRQHPASVCSIAARNGDVERARGKFLYWLQAYLDRHALSNSEVLRALQRELRPYEYPTVYRLGRRVRRFFSNRVNGSRAAIGQALRGKRG